MEKYKVLIGLEMHCEISETNTKVFSSAKNSYTDIPNSNIMPVDMAFPGTLPVVNKEAIKKALMASIILNCKQPEYIYFERKNYYYPDLPKGYQITQETKPAPMGIYGCLSFEIGDKLKSVRINNIHLEEDSAAMDHYSASSRIDYNRAGVPLLELVTEPDFNSADEAVAFLENMRLIYQYAGISEADTKKGQIRCDVNVSIMESDKDESNPNNWGTKIEIKNVNSFGGVRDTINYEIERQIKCKEDGTYDKMEQQTRRWDEESGTTIYMRSKVDAIDYKYFVEPNIPKFKVSPSWIEEIKSNIPLLPNARKKKYLEEYKLTPVEVKTIVKEKNISDYYDEVISLKANPKSVSNWLTTIILGYLNKNNIDISDINLTPKMLADLISLVESNRISSKQGKEVLYKSLEENKEPLKIVEEEGIKQLEDTSSIENIVDEILNNHLDMIEEYKNGRTNVADFLVGQVMKQTKGQANPKVTREMILNKLNN